MNSTVSVQPDICWRLNLTPDNSGFDQAYQCDVCLSCLLNNKCYQLSGRVVAFEEDPPFTQEIWKNQLLLDDREAQRLLSRLFEMWRYEVADFAGGMSATLDLKAFLKRRYLDRGETVWESISEVIAIAMRC